MESTQEQPLRFFERFILFGEVETYLINKIDDFVSHTSEQIINIDYKKFQVNYSSFPESKNVKKFIYDPKKELETLLSSEVLKSMDFINNSSVKLKEEEFDRLIKYIKLTLNHIVKSGEKNIIKVPELIQPLNRIVHFINNKYLNESRDKVSLDLNRINGMFATEKVCSNKEVIVISILGYLKGENDKSEKIMSDEEFDLMLGYVKFYISKKKEPNISKKIKKIKISNNLLRFTFWVLHKKLYTTRPIKESFINMMKSIFENFDNTELSTLKSKFGNKDKVTYQGVSFIPETIKLELMP